MKKIDTQYILANTGMPIKSGSLNHIFDSISESSLANYKALHTNYDGAKVNVFSGCINIVGAGYININEGSVLWGGELFYVPSTAFTITDTAVAVISTSYVVGVNADPVLMTDGSNKNVHEIRTIEIIDGNSLSPNYVADFSQFVYGNGNSQWKTHVIVAGDITNLSGGSFTLSSGLFAYKIERKTVIINLYLLGTQSGGSTSTYRIAFPPDIPSTTSVGYFSTGYDTSTDKALSMAVVVNTLNLQGIFANGSHFITGQVTFAIQ